MMARTTSCKKSLRLNGRRTKNVCVCTRTGRRQCHIQTQASERKAKLLMMTMISWHLLHRPKRNDPPLQRLNTPPSKSPAHQCQSPYPRLSPTKIQRKKNCQTPSTLFRLSRFPQRHQTKEKRRRLLSSRQSQRFLSRQKNLPSSRPHRSTRRSAKSCLGCSRRFRKLPSSAAPSILC